MDEENFQQEESSQQTEKHGFVSELLSVEGVMMIIVAALLDLFGLIEVIPILGSLLSYVVDIVAVLLIGGWLVFFRSKKFIAPEKVTKKLGKGLGKWFIRGLCVTGEVVPVVGALPLWTGLVLYELLNGD